jgi:beta-lysine 5,6-aminomutase alpha subunit
MLSIENAKYVFNNARDLGSEIEFKEDGMIQQRAQSVLKDAEVMLKDIEKEGIFSTIQKGKFGGVKRSFDGGKGLDGVVEKSDGYFNPFIALMLGGEKECLKK